VNVAQSWCPTSMNAVLRVLSYGRTSSGWVGLTCSESARDRRFCAFRAPCWKTALAGFVLVCGNADADASPKLLAIWGAQPSCIEVRTDRPPLHPRFKAAPGEILSVSATGLGATNPSVPAGVAPATAVPTVATPRITVGDRVAEVLSSHLVAWAPGIYQVNFEFLSTRPMVFIPSYLVLTA
jgi:hypothetical protein